MLTQSTMANGTTMLLGAAVVVASWVRLNGLDQYHPLPTRFFSTRATASPSPGDGSGVNEKPDLVRKRTPPIDGRSPSQRGVESTPNRGTPAPVPHVPLPRPGPPSVAEPAPPPPLAQDPIEGRWIWRNGRRKPIHITFIGGGRAREREDVRWEFIRNEGLARRYTISWGPHRNSVLVYLNGTLEGRLKDGTPLRGTRQPDG